MASSYIYMNVGWAYASQRALPQTPQTAPHFWALEIANLRLFPRDHLASSQVNRQGG